MATATMRVDAAIEKLTVSAYTIPTDLPESDGTLAWDKTTLVLVELQGGGANGLGYSYADRATATVIDDLLRHIVVGRDAFAIAAARVAMVARVRNLGRDGIAAMAISAVDNALWDLKARLLDVSLVTLLGACRDEVAVYGSGGFTSYTVQQLQAQLAGWVERGIPRVKMKVGRDPAADPERVQAARRAIGERAALFVDANGAYHRQQAARLAERFAAAGVSWFEEPVSSDDLDGLRWLRSCVPHQIDIAAGEYGYDTQYFRRMLGAEAVDVLQADATRCIGISGFVEAGALADAFMLPLSAHCAPSMHAHVGCAVPRLVHLEYFHDHARIEPLLFDGVLTPVGGMLRPDRTRPGCGLTLKRKDAARYAV